MLPAILVRKVRSTGRWVRASVIAGGILLTSGAEAAPSDDLFLSSYEKALHLLTFTNRAGVPLLETSYESLHLFESCAKKQLTSRGQKKAVELLNQKLSSPRFAQSYQAYRSFPKKGFTKEDLEIICSALAHSQASL